MKKLPYTIILNHLIKIAVPLTLVLKVKRWCHVSFNVVRAPHIYLCYLLLVKKIPGLDNPEYF